MRIGSICSSGRCSARAIAAALRPREQPQVAHHAGFFLRDQVLHQGDQFVAQRRAHQQRAGESFGHFDVDRGNVRIIARPGRRRLRGRGEPPIDWPISMMFPMTQSSPKKREHAKERKRERKPEGCGEKNNYVSSFSISDDTRTGARAACCCKRIIAISTPTTRMASRTADEPTVPKPTPPFATGFVSTSPKVAPKGRVRTKAIQNKNTGEVRVKRAAAATAAIKAPMRTAPPANPSPESSARKSPRPRAEGVGKQNRRPVEDFHLEGADIGHGHRVPAETPVGEYREQDAQQDQRSAQSPSPNVRSIKSDIVVPACSSQE